MKKYLIKIKAPERNLVEGINYNPDSLRPYQIAGNLWNYVTIGYAARRLEILAKAWEQRGLTVERVYGFI